MDRYSFTARLLPATIVLLPPALAVAAWVGNGQVAKSLGVGVTWLALSYLATQIVRDEGKKREKALWTSWGGPPTTQLLRHGNPSLSSATRERYHRKLDCVVPGVSVPTTEIQALDPLQADVVYQSCVDFMLEATRDTRKYALLFKENVSYGFRRNLWAMKPAALALVLSSIGFLALRVYALLRDTASVDSFALMSLVVASMLFAIWTVRITPSWVRRAADAYAIRLLGALDSM